MADRYRLLEIVGRGGMGEVWRARDELLGRFVAVKLLLAQHADASAATRFRMEAKTSAALSHPHVVGVLDFGSWDGRLFLVMELVEGGSLADETSSGRRLAPARVAVIAVQAAAGLAAAHRQGIVHRDIKPGNLLLDTDGMLKIGDFGIARFVDDPGAALTATGQVVGTSLYLAPERALGKPAGPASDVYGLGCVLYQLLTGRPPFQADTALAILHQHLDAAPMPPRETGADLPPAFESYLLGLLAKEPEDRPGAAQVADWFASEAWRGRPEPLPQELPGLGHVARASAPGGARPGPSGHGSFAGSGPGPVADTEWRTSVHRAAPRARGEWSRLASLRRSRTAAPLGGVVLFVVAVLVGMVWFAPGDGAAQGTQGGSSAPASPSESSPTIMSVTQGAASSPSSTSSMSPSPAHATNEGAASNPPGKADKKAGKGKR